MLHVFPYKIVNQWGRFLTIQLCRFKYMYLSYIPHSKYLITDVNAHVWFQCLIIFLFSLYPFALQPVGLCPESLQIKRPWRHPDQTSRPLQLAPVQNKEALNFKLVLDAWAVHPISKGEPCVWCSVSFFQPRAKSHDHRWGLEYKWEWTIKLKALPFGFPHDFPMQERKFTLDPLSLLIWS